MTRLVRDFPNGYDFVCDSQDIEDTLSSISTDRTIEDVGSLFVLVGEGEYLEVWASIYNVPRLDHTYTRIYNGY